MRTLRWLASALLLCSLGALADDVIHLANGTTVRGQILEQTDEEIIIQTAHGERVISWADVLEIEKLGSVSDTFTTRFDGLRDWDVNGYLELAAWAVEREYAEGVERAYRKVIELDPDNRKARRELGYRKYDGQWMLEREYKLAQGWVEIDGELVSPEVAEKLRMGLVYVDGEWVAKVEPRTGSGGASDAPLVLPEGAKELIQIIDHNKNREKWEAAAARLVEMGGDPFEALKQSLQQRVDKARKSYLSAAKSKLADGRKFLAQELNAARKEALRIVFDLSIYPDENHGIVGQPVVDEAVNKVRAIWENPISVLLDQSTSLQEARQSLVQALADQLRFAGEAAALEAVEQEVAADLAERLNLQGAPIDAADKAAFDYSQRVVAYNARVETSLDAEERNCITETNQYRMMMGLRALHIDERQVQAARKHSVDMRTSGFFDHHSPNTGSPTDRVRREGARYSGENIAMGSGTGRGAFLQWYNSSGHHRNILTRDHLTIGIGRDGTYWTQDFGVDSVN